jgi:hypothetical protein
MSTSSNVVHGDETGRAKRTLPDHNQFNKNTYAVHCRQRLAHIKPAPALLTDTGMSIMTFAQSRKTGHVPRYRRLTPPRCSNAATAWVEYGDTRGSVDANCAATAGMHRVRSSAVAARASVLCSAARSLPHIVKQSELSGTGFCSTSSAKRQDTVEAATQRSKDYHVTWCGAGQSHTMGCGLLREAILAQDSKCDDRWERS